MVLSKEQIAALVTVLAGLVELLQAVVSLVHMLAGT